MWRREPEHRLVVAELEMPADRAKRIDGDECRFERGDFRDDASEDGIEILADHFRPEVHESDGGGHFGAVEEAEGRQISARELRHDNPSGRSMSVVRGTFT